MPRKNNSLEKDDYNSWLNSNLLISLCLFLCTYIVLGWAIASTAGFWLLLLKQQNISITFLIEQDSLLFVIKIIALFVIITISLFLSTPVALITFVFEESINSDIKAFIAILFWSVLLVFIFCSFEYFADLLVVTAVNILFRLDLQKLKYPRWVVRLIIFTLAFLSFMSGVYLFDHFNSSDITDSYLN
ncbi:hypothetical protein [Cyanobacterium sp. Dongsha4]|uniref:hypothetical protein n=1 Tax=Cyanobacterium sp. DS4 TaxID=2878255 RepID=UPI002E80D9B2|nr:hypothetical protein [Cyanobacterium sp. Dongsha4]WVL02189.1 hypothetical protein Dongsha4_08360 [Cyanobacterium sp. Dongsha4]